MIYNQLIVLPTDATLDYLSQVMSGSSLDLNPQLFKVDVMTSEDQMEPDLEAFYIAKPVKLEVWYDSNLQLSSLILSLQSHDLARRCMQLHEQGVERSFFDSYHFYMTIKPQMPPLGKRYQHFKRSTADILCGSDRILEFGHELVAKVEYNAAPDADYQQAMSNELDTRRYGD